LSRKESIISFIDNYRQGRRVGPSIQDIMDGTGASSTSVVHYWVKKALEAGELVAEFSDGRMVVRSVDINDD